jgi:hypothetical protein
VRYLERPPTRRASMTKRIIPPAPAISVLAPDSKVREIVRQLRNVAIVGMSSDLGSDAALDASVDPDVVNLLVQEGILVVTERNLEKEFFRYAG